MNGEGFYLNGGSELFYAPTFVLNANFELHAEQKDTYEYPVEGWYWFNSENEARAFFGLPLVTEEQVIE